MTVFIAHAQADRSIAETLASDVRAGGLFAEAEDGGRGFRIIGSADAVIVLYSRAVWLSPQRLMMERRAMEAWAQGRLVLVRLDHTILPIGLRDLPAIDAAFVEQRALLAWPAVISAARRAQSGAAAPDHSALTTEGPDDDGVPQRASDWLEDRGSDAPARMPGASPDGGAYLFISYARANSGAVRPVVDELKDNGRAVWLDAEAIHDGANWAGEIVRAIKGAARVMVMCSAQAFESDHVKREVYLADRYKRRLLPVYLDEAPPPEDFEYFFADLQPVRLVGVADADRPKRILAALRG